MSASNHTNCVSLNNQKYMTQPTFINLHSYEYSQELCYYPFVVNLDRCDGRCNTLDDRSSRVYISNETENLNLNVFNMKTEINKSRTLTKHISCKCKCKFDGRKCNLNQKWNNNKCLCTCKNPKEYFVSQIGYFWNLARCSCKNGKYAGSIGDSVFICDKFIDRTKCTSTKVTITKTVPTKCNLTNFCILLSFL